MDRDIPWHENDAFWEQYAHWGFSKARWDDASSEIGNLLVLMDLAPGAAVADLGCGRGRHVLELARRGFRVTGVDRTAAFLEEARERVAMERLEADLVCEDIRRFERPEAFDAAVSLFTSFGYFYDHEENMRVLRNAFASLRPGGLLVVDVMGKEVLARRFAAHDWFEDEGCLVLQERNVVDAWSRMENRWVIVAKGELHEFYVDHWIYSATELRKMMKDAGFNRTEAFGDFIGTPYKEDASRLVVVGRK